MVNLASNPGPERAARNREYSRKHRAKRNSELNELKVLKTEALPQFFHAIVETISTLERDKDIPKAIQNLGQVQNLLYPYLAQELPSSSFTPSPPVPVTQTHEQSDLLTTSSLLVPVMDSQQAELNSLARLFFDLTQYQEPAEVVTMPSCSYAFPSTHLPSNVSMFGSHQMDETLFPYDL